MENLKTNDGNNNLNEKQAKELKKTIKKYVNLYKSLHFIDPAIAAEFKKKQEFYFSEVHNSKNKNSHQHMGGGCCGSKINNKSKRKFKKFILLNL